MVVVTGIKILDCASRKKTVGGIHTDKDLTCRCDLDDTSIIVKSSVLIALIVTTVTVLTGENASRLECVDSLNMPAILEYIRNENKGSYYDEKERAQTVLDQLHQKLDERLEARIKSYTEEYKQYMDESSDEYHPVKGERLPEIIKHSVIQMSIGKNTFAVSTH